MFYFEYKKPYFDWQAQEATSQGVFKTTSLDFSSLVALNEDRSIGDLWD